MPDEGTIPPGEPSEPEQGTASLDAVVESYLARKAQLATVVRAFGGKFISGLEPTCNSKGSLSEKETRWIHDAARNSESLRRRYAAVPEGYRKLLTMRSPDATRPQGDCDAFVDFHTMFGRYRDETLFGDHIHLLPEGDRLVGETYACAVWEALEAAGRLAARPALRRDP